jgi:uncharacterized protein YaeQ
MALGATISRALVNVANMDTNYYNEHNFTLAQHPSETDLRLMVRIVAFILNADDELAFCKGISQEDEPDLWQKNYGGEIELWIDLGQPDEKRIKKACGRSDRVIIYTYQEGMAKAWFKQNENTLKRFKNLEVIHLNVQGELENFAKKGMNFQANISDGELHLIDGDTTVVVTKEFWL